MNRIGKFFSNGIRVLTSSWISLLGTVVVLVSGVFIVAGAVSEALEAARNPYQSLITFAVLPAILAGGVVLVIFGIVSSRRKREQGIGFVFDMNIARHRNLLVFFLVTSVIVFVVLMVGTFKAYEYTESVAFCGEICHEVMRPEHTAYQQGSHARVRCAECHIGPGAPWFVRSKLSGARQLLSVFTGDYSRPISTPVHNLRPARDTCEQCHWPEVFHGKKLVSYERIGEDGSFEDPIISAVILNIGGYNKRTQRNVGIHWHISTDNKVEYQAVDLKRTKIKRIRVSRADGTKSEYVNEKLPEPPKEYAVWRTMDCIDCHNRPAHRFKDPADGLDQLLLTGQIDHSIDGIRETTLEALTREYKTQDEAELGIRTAMRELYAKEAKNRFDIFPEQSISAAVKLYKTNVFPEMNIGWNNYIEHIGHRSSPGCFRCHDEKHEDERGEVLSQDCELCHEVLAEEEAYSTLDPKVKAYIMEH